MMGSGLLQGAAFQGQEQLSHFIGLLLVILLAVLQGRVGRAGAFWQICWFLPGTVLHELSHLLAAALTGGRPVGFSIIPRREGGGRWRLGSVTISRPGTLSALPSGLAPLALNAVAYYIYLGWPAWFGGGLAHNLLMYPVVYLFCYSSIPSGQDLKVAFSRPAGVVLYGGVVAAGWYFWG